MELVLEFSMVLGMLEKTKAGSLQFWAVLL
jgi:hypothetical protein